MYLIRLPIHLIYILIYLAYLSDLSDLYRDLSLRFIWSRSWSIWSICPNNLNMSWSIWSTCPIYLIEIMTYLVYLSHLPDLHHNLSDPSVQSRWSVSSSICSICPINPIHILIFLSDLSDRDHDLYDPSARSLWSRSRSTWSIFRSIWSISWSLSSICPIYLIYIMIYPSNLSALDHDLCDLSVRSISYIMIYVIYLSDLSDWDHDQSCLSVRFTWSRSWFILSICPIYVI